MRVWPSGWVCQAVRAPGSNVTLLPAARAGAFAGNSGSMRTVPVNQSAGPLADGCDPTLVISIVASSRIMPWAPAWPRRTAAASTVPAVARNVRREGGMARVLARRPASGAEQRLDRPSLVHRPVALRPPVEGQGQVKHLAGVNLPVQHQLDEPG